MFFLKKKLFFNPGEWLFLVWFLIVYFSYLYFHKGLQLFIFTVILILSLYLFYKLVYKKMDVKIQWQVQMSLGQIMVVLFICSYIIACFLNVIYIFNNGNDIQFLQLLLHWFSILIVMLSRAIFLLALFVLCASLGRKILRIWNFLFDNVYIEYLVSFGMGMMIILLVSFFMGVLGLLYFWYIVLALIAIGLLCRGEIRSTFVNFFSQKVSLRLTDNFFDKKNIIHWGFAFLIIFLLITFIQTFHLVPTEYDDYDTYYSVPLLFAHYHGMVPFYNSVSAIAGGIVMPFYALVNVLLSPDYNFSISWMFFWLSMIALYFFTRRFFSQNVAIITIFLSVFVPMNVDFISTQKIDFIIVFFSILALYGLFLWLENKEKKWLYLSAIFLGFAVNVKFNGLFLVLTVGIFLFILLCLRRMPLKQFLCFTAIVFLFLSPMFVYNFFYYKNPIAPFSFPFYSRGQKNIFLDNTRVTIYEIYKQVDAEKIDELNQIIRRNSIGESTLANFLWFWWNITINQKGFNDIFSEISPFVLIFLPVYFIFFFTKKLYQNKSLLFISILSVIFLIIWFYRGIGRPWYALPIFYFLFILCAWVFKNIKSKIIFSIVYLLLFIFFLRTFFYSFFFIDSFPYILNTIEPYKEAVAKAKQDDSLLAFYDYVNKNIMNNLNGTKILMMPESRTATLYEWDKNVIADHWGIYWHEALKNSKSMDDIKNVLITQGISHIVFSENFYLWIKYLAQGDINQYIIGQDLNSFQAFAEKFLVKLHCQENIYCIYEVRK